MEVRIEAAASQVTVLVSQSAKDAERLNRLPGVLQFPIPVLDGYELLNGVGVDTLLRRGSLTPVWTCTFGTDAGTVVDQGQIDEFSRQLVLAIGPLLS